VDVTTCKKDVDGRVKPGHDRGVSPVMTVSTCFWTRESVMRGLDPRIHDEAQIQNSCDSDRLRCLMDCRVKPGNDGGEAGGAAVP
jgi:hypothetical protein